MPVDQSQSGASGGRRRPAAAWLQDRPARTRRPQSRRSIHRYPGTRPIRTRHSTSQPEVWWTLHLMHAAEHPPVLRTPALRWLILTVSASACGGRGAKVAHRPLTSPSRPSPRLPLPRGPVLTGLGPDHPVLGCACVGLDPPNLMTEAEQRQRWPGSGGGTAWNLMILARISVAESAVGAVAGPAVRVLSPRASVVA